MNTINRDLEKSFIQVNELSVSYKQEEQWVQALKDISFRASLGEFTVLIGPSGCGKTTLLMVLSGLLKPDSGSVYIDQTLVTAQRLDSGLILQNYGLLPWKTVEQNVMLGLQVRGTVMSEAKRKTKAVLEELGIEELSKRYPQQLSGGQSQRVAIARSLALEPKLLLMDEPFSSLDALTREKLQQLLLGIWQKKKINMVMVTHSIEEAVFMGQRIIVMTKSPGTISRVVENALSSEEINRRSDSFYRQCGLLRELLEAQ